MSLRDSGKAFYIFSIDKLEESEKNSNIIDVYFGGKNFPYRIHKANINDFCKALLPEYDDFYKDYFNKNKGFSLKEINALLKGRALVVVTDFENYLEYLNGGMNSIVGVTTININGDFKAKELDDLFKDDVAYEELYPNTNVMEEFERDDI